ncbi:unnamed protein product [Cochlearia groenlandica]
MTHKIVDLQRIVNDKSRITTYKKRKACLYKKAEEFSTLCGVKTCLIVYGPTRATDEVVSEPELWPRDETKVRNIIRKYKETISNSCKKENHVETFVNDLGKAKDMEIRHKIKAERNINKNNNKKYCSWDQKKLNKCSQEDLLVIYCAVENKLNEAMIRAHHNHEATKTQAMQSFNDQQHYNMQQYYPDQQQQFQGSMYPNNYNNMGFSFMSQPHDEIDTSLVDNFTELGLNQSMMMPTKGASSCDGGNNQWWLRTPQPYSLYNNNNNNHEPVLQRSVLPFNVNPLTVYQNVSLPWSFPVNQTDHWVSLEKKMV